MNWSSKIITHKTEKRIAVYFEKNAELIARMKQIEGSRWSQSLQVWHVPDTSENRIRFKIVEKTSQNTYAAISLHNQAVLQYYIQAIQLKGYSAATLKTYKNEFIPFLVYLKEQNAKDCETATIRNYILYCINDLKLTESTVHSRMNAIKFYYEQVLHNDKIFIEIPRPKKPYHLPKVLALEEVKKLFEVTPNLKHNTMLKLC